MNKIGVAFLIVFSITHTIKAQSIQWMTLEEALSAQKEVPKKIIIDVYTDWCGPCKLMDKKTFGNRDVSQYINENFYAVKFNAEGNEEVSFFETTFKNPKYNPARKGRRNATHQLTRFFGIRGYPTVVFISEDGAPIMPVTGYLTPQQLELYLKMIKQGDYQIFGKPEDFEKYRKTFRPKFRG